MRDTNIKQNNANNYIMNFTTHTERKKEITELCLEKESTDVGTEKKITV